MRRIVLWLSVLVIAATGLRAAPADAEPNGWSLRIDCDLTAAGVQAACTTANGALQHNVAVVIENGTPGADSVASFQILVTSPDKSRLNPLSIPCGMDCKNANPDFNQAQMPGAWDCGEGVAPPPVADDGTAGPMGARSRLSCFITTGPGVAVGAGGSLTMASVRYSVATVTGGSVTIDADAMTGIGNEFGVKIIECDLLFEDTGECFTATVTIPCFIDVADVNNSGQVNVIDLVVVAYHQNDVPVSPLYDVNSDGSVNVIDLLRIAQVADRRTNQCVV
jgi:hypothetical protein